MNYGTKDLDYLIPSEEDPIVKCNNCDTYHYESLGGKSDTLNLQLLTNEGEDNPYKGCGNCQTDGYLMDIDQPEKKKPKLMVVGHVDHGATTLATRMAMASHDVTVVSPDEAREITFPYHAPAPIPILEEPFTITERVDYELVKSGREQRNERRKKNKKRNRRY